MRYLPSVLLSLVISTFAVATPPDLNKDASHEETTPLASKGDTKCNKLTGLALAGDGNLLACDASAKVIKVISPDDKLVTTWKLSFTPTKLLVSGEITYVGGDDALVKLDKTGKEIAKAVIGDKGLPKGSVAGIAIDGDNVYASYAYTTGALRGIVVRMNKDLAEPKTIVTGLRGCCGNMDITASAGVVWAAENAGHRVRSWDSQGKEKATWGKSDRENIEAFASCCNPMNIAIGSDGAVYTGESSPERIKKYDTAGKYLGLVGYLGLKPLENGKIPAVCSSAHFVINKDATKLYVVDESNSLIRVLSKKK